MASSGWPSPWRPNSSRLLTTPSLLAPMSTRISSLSMRTTWPSTTSPCLKLLMSESCSARSSSIVVGSGPRSRAGVGSSSSSLAAGASAVSSALSASPAGSEPAGGWPLVDASMGVADDSSTVAADASAAASATGAASSSAVAAGASTAVLSASVVVPASSVLVAGSSATATAATVSSDAWSAAEALASGSGVGPPCCSSVKGLVTPGGGFAPENHERPERCSSRVRNVQVVRGDRLRGPLLRASNGLVCRSCAVRAPWGRESLAHAFRPLQSPRRARIARSDRGRRCAPRRPGGSSGPFGERARSARGAWHPGRAGGARRPARRVDPAAGQVPPHRPRSR